MSSPTPEELAAAGLYDPDDEQASERLELIAYLLSLGATVEELVAAAPNLVQVASARALLGAGERFTQAEAAERAGVSIDAWTRFWRAAGLPDPGPEARVCTDEDVEMLRTLQAGAALLGEDVVMQVTRVIGSSMARVADACISAFIVNVAAPSLADDPGGLSLARSNTEGVLLLRQAVGAMDVIFRHHVELLQRPLTPGDQTTQQLVVGFVDLVGSTELGQQMAVAELGALLAEFDEVTSDVVVPAGGRVVKLIGDEAMFVVADPAAGCEIALRLASTFSNHPRLPPVRGGIAFGALLSRDGDYFGPVVNLAARIVKVCGPGTILTTAEVRDAVDAYRFTPVGARELKGFDQSVELFELSEDRDT